MEAVTELVRRGRRKRAGEGQYQPAGGVIGRDRLDRLCWEREFVEVTLHRCPAK
jgi:hypothetical protein